MNSDFQRWRHTLRFLKDEWHALKFLKGGWHESRSLKGKEKQQGTIFEVLINKPLITEVDVSKIPKNSEKFPIS